jgi:hypothetical protein
VSVSSPKTVEVANIKIKGLFAIQPLRGHSSDGSSLSVSNRRVARGDDDAGERKVLAKDPPRVGRARLATSMPPNPPAGIDLRNTVY